MYYQGQLNRQVPYVTVRKKDIETMFRNNYPNCNISKLDEFPKMWRHCCGVGGIQVFNPIMYKHYYVTLHYIYCPKCNKITYFAEGI